jgi:hypothetical protein
MSALPIDHRLAPARRGGSAVVLRFPIERTGNAAAAPAAGLRITRRGRLAVTLLVATVLAIAGGTSATRAAAGSEAPRPVDTVLVMPGDTLWSIAGAVAGPGEDVRDVIAEIVDVNDLPTSAVFAGQELTVPRAG